MIRILIVVLVLLFLTNSVLITGIYSMIRDIYTYHQLHIVPKNEDDKREVLYDQLEETRRSTVGFA